MFSQKSNIFNREGKIESSFMGLILQIVLFSFIFDSLHPVVDGAEAAKKQYAIVFDAGASSTKLLIYQFLIIYPDERLILKDEFFTKVSPGLSSYRENAAKAAESIKGLLEKVKSFVPQEFWASTPLVLKATAGLRSLKPVEADNLLKAVREVLSRSGFLVKDNAVEIMDGVAEGLFSWFTVNVLLGRLDNVNLGQNTVAALDMGGGSTQVSFASKDPNATPSLVDYIRTISKSKAKVNVFSSSYSNLGLDAARQGVIFNGETTDASNYASECVNPIINAAEFKFASKTYHVSGKNNSKSTAEKPVVDYYACVNLVKRTLVHLVNPRPITLNQNEVVAFSGFYWRAMSSGIIPESGGEATVEQFVQKTKEVCTTADTRQPFMCLDLTYLSVLLTDGYGLDTNTKIEFYRQVNGREISWALGCAYNLLSDISWSTN